MKKQHLVGALIIIVIAVPVVTLAFVYSNGRSTNSSPKNTPPTNSSPTNSPPQNSSSTNSLPPNSSSPTLFSYRIVNTYSHDVNAFTEGLVFDGGFLYESTGLNGESTLRRVELTTGKVLQLYVLPTQFFGEGITIFNHTIIQLTWQSHVGFVYDENTFALLRNFTYTTEGWGLTCDGSRLIMSDGTANLYFLNSQTFQRIGQVEVHDGNTSITELNELEYVNGSVYANVWQTNKIVIINPQNGQVKGWIDLTGIEKQTFQDPANDVLNGIAYDARNDRLFVTGKMWPELFQVDLVPS